MKKVSKKKRLQGEAMYTSVEAAALLGVTARTIQIWADNGILPARRTSGGHRRFPESVLEAFIRETNPPAGEVPARKPETRSDRYRILIAEDEAFLRTFYETVINVWGLPIDVSTAPDGYETLIRFGTLSPDMLIADLMMPKIDGFQLIRAIDNSDHSPETDIVVVTALTEEEITAGGGLPEGVIVLHKPTPFPQLQAIITNRMRQKYGATA